MAHNFRIAGAAVFGSKAPTSSDSNNGLTPETAKATAAGFFAALIAAAANAIGAISGTHKENMAPGTTTGVVKTVYGDGYAKFVGTGSKLFMPAAGILTFHRLIFQDFVHVGLSNGVNSGNSITFYDCIFDSCAVGGGRVNIYIRCEFRNCTRQGTSLLQLEDCKLLEGTVLQATRAINCDVRGEDGSRLIQAALDAAGTVFNYNNIRGEAIKLPADAAYVTLDQFKINNPGNQPSSFTADPLYSNPNAGVYTVAANSPNLKTGNQAANIGNVKIGVAFVSSQTSTTDPFSLLNPKAHFGGMVVAGNGVTVDPTGPGHGWRVSAWFLVNNGRLARLLAYAPIQNIEANKSFAGGDIENMNVPDYGFLFDGANAAKYNPDRLTYGLQTSSIFDEPSSVLENNPDADNSGLWGVGTFKPFEYFKEPLVWVNPANVAETKTAGELDFPYADTANMVYPNARWVRVYEVFTSNYNNVY